METKGIKNKSYNAMLTNNLNAISYLSKKACTISSSKNGCLEAFTFHNSHCFDLSIRCSFPWTCLGNSSSHNPTSNPCTCFLFIISWHMGRTDFGKTHNITVHTTHCDHKYFKNSHLTLSSQGLIQDKNSGQE